jgi:predicted short-subunit dehydrogenase-like oxidoreductase (DUF2520 family)
MAARRSSGSPRRVSFRRPAVLGTGRAGSALLHSLAAAGIHAAVVGNRSPVRWAPEGSRRARGVARTVDAAVAEGADILFIAVSDGALDKVAAAIGKRPALPPVVVHLSGAQGCEALAALEPRTQTAAFHPLAALDPHRPIPEGTVIGITVAEAPLFRRLSALALRLGLRGERVRKGRHAGYHLGASIAANLPVALLAESAARLRAAGLDEEAALAAAVGLMRSAVDNADGLLARGGTDLGEVLTGPIARGDDGTVARHLDALADGDLDAAYRALSRRLVDLGHLDDTQQRTLRRLLKD